MSGGDCESETVREGEAFFKRIVRLRDPIEEQDYKGQVLSKL